MTQRTLMQRLLDERPATQGRDTWQQLEERLGRRRRPRALLALAAAAALLVVAVGVRVTSKNDEPSTEMYLFIARSDRPLSEGLELNLEKAP